MLEVAGEIIFRVTGATPDVVKSLKSPIRRLVAKNVTLPHSRELEAQLLPYVEDIVAMLTWR